MWASVDQSARAEPRSSRSSCRRDAPGLSIARLEHKLGIRASDTAVLLLQDCRIPKDNILGNPEVNVEQGFAGVMQTFDNTRPIVAAMAVGVGRAALEELRRILVEAGVRFIRHPATPARGGREFLGSRRTGRRPTCSPLRAAWMADNKQPNSLEASMAKAKAGRTANDITLSAVELTSTLGYSEHHLLEKWAPRLEDPRHLRRHPADPAADRRPQTAGEDLSRAEIAVSVRDSGFL